MNLEYLNKYIFNIKQLLISFYGNYSSETFVNYVEYFSWISGGIISLIGLLSIFLSVHYQTDMIAARNILRSLKTEKKSTDLVIKDLTQYFYITTEDMKGYIDNVITFKIFSIALVALWGFSCIGYLLSTETYAGITMIILSTIIFCLLIIIFIFKLENVYKKNLVLFPEFFDITNLLQKINKDYDVVTDILMPSFSITIFHESNNIIYSYNTKINTYNYGIVLSIKKPNSLGFFYHLGLKVKVSSDGIKEVTQLNINDEIHGNMNLNKELGTLNLGKYSSSIAFFIGNKSILYNTNLSIIEDDDKLVITCIPVEKYSSQVPLPLINSYNEIDESNNIFDFYHGKVIKCKNSNSKFAFFCNIKKKLFKQ